MKFISKSEEETKRFVPHFFSFLRSNKEKATIIGLSGNLGAGKTTFMKYLGNFLGIKESIQSPTFVIMKKYKILDANRETLNLESDFKNLVHIDAYRIEKPEEMIILGFKEIIKNPQNLVFIEWPEKIAEILPDHTILKFEYGDGENERIITTNQS